MPAAPDNYDENRMATFVKTLPLIHVILGKLEECGCLDGQTQRLVTATEPHYNTEDRKAVALLIIKPGVFYFGKTLGWFS